MVVEPADHPLEIKTGTLRFIADHCGAEDFYDWCRWIDEQS